MLYKRYFIGKMQGIPRKRFVRFLNVLLIPSPYVYKKISGQSYKSGFVDRRKQNSLSNMTNNKDVNETSGQFCLSDNTDTQKVLLWSPVAVRRILKNQLYIGILQQGKTRKINYKLAQRCKVPPEEWISTDKAVPPIIEESLFWKCQSR